MGVSKSTIYLPKQATTKQLIIRLGKVNDRFQCISVSYSISKVKFTPNQETKTHWL